MPGCLSLFNDTFLDEIYTLLNNYIMVTPLCLIFLETVRNVEKAVINKIV